MVAVYTLQALSGEEPEEPAQSRVTPIFAQNFNVSNISDTSIRANATPAAYRLSMVVTLALKKK